VRVPKAERDVNRRLPRFHPTVVVQPRSKGAAIAAAQAAFARCQFDERGCSFGLRRLRAYRKEWDESRGVWKDRPRHDEALHGADAFLTLACSGYTPPSPLPPRKPLDRRLEVQVDCPTLNRLATAVRSESMKATSSLVRSVKSCSFPTSSGSLRS
jgi:hypothetical protein